MYEREEEEEESHDLIIIHTLFIHTLFIHTENKQT